ncbi:MAG: Na+/H+ antiporter NhaA, partial [Sphingobacteriales bacterium]|nr:Na+/H+ antiporter NhaA [Sphingobacteriales bacterium]
MRQKTIDPFLNFIHDSRSVGIILLVCTVSSLLLANSSLTKSYFSIINFELPVNSFLHLPHTIIHCINDGLMAVFFFLAGMEIKREITTGELSSLSKSILPIIAAIGGMVIPAFIYLLINKNTLYVHGWAIPMATDIAFSLGICALLGKRVPIGLKIFLTALAIIDDLGAIITIAIFYTAAIDWLYLGFAVLISAILYLLLRLNIFNYWNFILGMLLWYCFLNSGIHATIAGVIFAFFIPASRLNTIENYLHIPVNFLIIPLFALANTALILPATITSVVNTSVSWGIFAGLVIGKPLGISAATYFTVKFKWATL